MSRFLEVSAAPRTTYAMGSLDAAYCLAGPAAVWDSVQSSLLGLCASSVLPESQAAGPLPEAPPGPVHWAFMNISEVQASPSAKQTNPYLPFIPEP